MVQQTTWGVGEHAQAVGPAHRVATVPRPDSSEPEPGPPTSHDAEALDAYSRAVVGVAGARGPAVITELVLRRQVRPIDRRSQRILGCGATVVEVVSAERNGPAWRGGLLEGDRAAGVDGESVRSVSDTERLLVGRQGGTRCRLDVVRSGRPLAVTAGEAQGESARGGTPRERSTW